MTAAQPNLGQPALVTADADVLDDRLAQLCAQYDQAKADAKKADHDLKVITNAIKVEMTKAAPGSNDVRLESPHLAQPLRLFPVVSERLDTKRIKVERPDFYDAYKTTSTAWQLRPVTS